MTSTASRAVADRCRFRTHLSEEGGGALLRCACGQRFGDMSAGRRRVRGLAAQPSRLLEHRESIVHSLRGDTSLAVGERREWFRQARCTQTLNTEVAAHVHTD